MEKLRKAENSKIKTQIGILTAIFSAFLGFMCWLQISQFTFNQFDNQCKETSYQSCMRWFWETKGFFQTVEIISIVVLLSALIYIAVNRIKNIL